MTSKEHLQKLQDITLQIIDGSEKLFEPLKEDIFNTNLQPKSWSIAQCLNHLNIYADFYHKQFKDVLSKAEQETFEENQEEIKYSWLGKNFLKYIELDENDVPKKKIKAPRKSFQSHSDFTKNELEIFLENQKELWSLLETAKERNPYRFKKVKTMFPLLSLRTIDMFGIHVHHNYRHFVQAKNVLNQIRIQAN